MTTKLKFSLILVISTLLASCSTTPSSEKVATSTEMHNLQLKLEEVELKAEDLEKIIDDLIHTNGSHFSDCSKETLPNPLARKICELAQGANDATMASLQVMLDAFTDQFSAQLDAAEEDIAAQRELIDSQMASIEAIEDSIVDITIALENLQTQFNDLNSRLTTLETAISALYSLVETLMPGSYNSCVNYANLPAAGTFDTTFGTNGILSWDRSGVDNQIQSIMTLGFGEFLVAETVGDSTKEVYLSRRNSDGGIDSDFGINGLSIGNFPNLSDNEFNGSPLAVAADGKIYMHGAVANNGLYDHGVIRLLANGAYDTSFATGGRLDFQTGSNQRLSPGLAILNDGSIILTERRTIGLTDTFSVSKFDYLGSPVASFGTNGTLNYALGANYSNASAQALPRVQSSGKIIIAGNVMTDSHTDIGISRINTNGTKDTTFGVNGDLILDLGNFFNDSISGMMILPDDNILLWGYIGTSQDGTDIGIVRLTADGELDFSFGSNGIFQYGYSATGNKSERAIDLVVQADGKIVVIAAATDGSVDRWLVLRFLTNMTLDTSFGNNGSVYITDGGIAGETPMQAKITHDQHLLIGGNVSLSDGTIDARVMKLNLGYELVYCN